MAASKNASPLRALIVTVGIPADPRLDIAEALIADVRALAPERLVLIASRESRKNAERMKEALGADDAHCRILVVQDATDIEEAFRRVNEATELLIADGLRPRQIAINFTSGTKVMGAGAVISAVFNRCRELRYLTGASGAEDRRRIVTTHPAAVFAFQDLLRGRTLARELRFESAQEILAGIDDSLLTERDCRVRSEMLKLTEAYAERLNYRPVRFLEAYRQVDFCAPLLDIFRLDDEGLKAVDALAAEFAAGRIGENVITELYNDGRRRLESGSPDEAVTRLYRALEMLAQWTLKRDHGIDTDDVETRRIPPRARVAFEALRSMEDGLVKIGLRKAYDLLTVFNSPIGLRFRDSETLRELLPRRSQSILAHGMNPLDPEDARRLFEAGRDLFRVAIADFDRRRKLLEFPWLGGRRAPRRADAAPEPTEAGDVVSA
jgi:CRISPR-associated protein (TIGR02710 family)